MMTMYRSNMRKQYKERSYWSKEEVEFLENNYPKLTFFEIGKELGRTAQLVRNKAVELGVYDIQTKKPTKRKLVVSNYKPSSINKINEMYKLRV